MGGVLQVFKLKGTRNKINRNNSTFYEIYTFYLEKMHNLCKCLNNLILSKFSTNSSFTYLLEKLGIKLKKIVF